jgi:CBS domain-containing protein
MMGGALGGLEAMALPNEGAGFWPLISMGAILGGTMRSPFTGIIFALELTHDMNVLLPLLVAATIAHAFTVLTLKRSILTEKVARRGYHLSREYAVDPLEILFVREVMRTNVVALPADMTLRALAKAIKNNHRGSQRLLPVVDSDRRLVGVLTLTEVQSALNANASAMDSVVVGKLARATTVEAFPGEPLRAVVYRMAESGFTRMPVVQSDGSRRLLGMVALEDLLKARVRNLEEERRRERVLPLHLRFLSRSGETNKAEKETTSA